MKISMILKRNSSYLNRSFNPAATAWVTIPLSCNVQKSPQPIWRSGTRRWNLRAPDLQMGCGDLTSIYDTSIAAPVMATITCPTASEKSLSLFFFSKTISRMIPMCSLLQWANWSKFRRDEPVKHECILREVEHFTQPLDEVDSSVPVVQSETNQKL